VPADILRWSPLLCPASVTVNPVPFTRSGGRSLGGIERAIRTDRGHWLVGYKGVTLYGAQKRRLWNMNRVALNGRAGLVAVPAYSFDSAPWPAGSVNGHTLVPHSDGSGFSDGSFYSQPSIVVEMVNQAALTDTSVTLRLVGGIDELAGVRFSYQHALYETGIPTLVEGDEWTVPIFPDIRGVIPADATLEFDLPTCLCRLATDREMDISLSAGGIDRADVNFIEAVDYWTDLA
jgi:hypothetical protein